MIDLRTIEHEVQQARLARIDAETAGSEVEDLIRLVQQFRPGRQRLVFMIDGCEPEILDAA